MNLNVRTLDQATGLRDGNSTEYSSYAEGLELLESSVTKTGG